MKQERMQPKQSEGSGEPRAVGRLESFSDAVFGVAITLLVLDLHVPRELPAGTRLVDALLGQWPAFLAFTISFITVLIVWIQHHRIFRYISRADNILFLLNGFCLLGAILMPFSTSLLSEYISKSEQTTALQVYICTYIVLGSAFNLLWWYARSKARLLVNGASASHAQGIQLEYILGTLACGIAFVFSYFSWLLGLLICAGMFAFFAVADRRERK